MALTRGRVLPRDRAEELHAPATQRTPPRQPLAKVVPRRALEELAEARRVLVAAREEATRIEQSARAEAAELEARLRAEAAAAAAARVAAWSVALTEREARADEAALDRSLGLARLLAERLLGEALRVDPGAVVGLARRALGEARGARRVTVLAHPDDARGLLHQLEALGAVASVNVVAEPHRARGSLRLETELGVLDAELGPQLDRLVAELRAAMLSPSSR